MYGPTTCPSCGGYVPLDAPRGLCPACLLRAARNSLRPEAALPVASLSVHWADAVEPGPGRTFGDYEVLEEIGHGGMGVVYRAHQLSLDRFVALKMMRPAPTSSDSDVSRFRQEARAAARLHHPNIIAIHEVSEVGGQHFYSMDLVDGRSLTDVVAGHPLSARRAATYVKLIAEAIHYAHQQGILHRDLKPSNILVDENDQPRIADFGLAKLLHGDSVLTLHGEMLGSPSYMAPEQARTCGEEVDVRTDVHALGGLLYYALTGRAPFRAETSLQTLRMVAESEPIAPRLLNPEVPRDVETICLKCLEKEPGRRYATAGELAGDLQRFLAGLPIRARSVHCVERAWRWCRRSPVRACLVGALVLVFTAGTAGVLWQSREANTARREAMDKLWGSYLAQARANRWSGRAGRRFDSLEVLGKAAAMRFSMDLRNEAIACMALPDARIARRWPLDPGYGLAFDVSLTRFARVDPDGTTRVRRLEDGADLQRLPWSFGAKYVTLRFSPAGRYLAEKRHHDDRAALRIWDLETGEPILEPDFPIRNLVLNFTADDRLVAFVQDNGLLHVRDMRTAQERPPFATTQGVTDLCFDPSGQRIALCSEVESQVTIYDVATASRAAVLAAGQCIHSVAWSGDGRLLAGAGLNGQVLIWDMSTQRLLTTLSGHTASVVGVAFDRRGDVLVSFGWDAMTWLWDPVTCRPLVSLPVGYHPAFGPNDEFLAFGMDDEFGLLDFAAARECRRFGPCAQVIAGNAATFSRDGALLFLGTREDLRVWDVARGRPALTLPIPEVRSVFFLPGDDRLFVSGHDGLSRWRVNFDEAQGLATMGEQQIIRRGRCEHACPGADGHSVAVVGCGQQDCDAVLINVESRTETRRFSGSPGSVWVAVPADGPVVVSGNWKGDGVHIRSATNGALIKHLPLGENVSVAMSPDGRWLLTGSGRAYQFWDSRTWEPGPVIQRQNAGDQVGAMLFSPDGRMLAFARRRDSEIKLIRAADLEELATLDAGPPLCFSPDGRLLVTLATDLRSVLVWDLPAIRSGLARLNLDWSGR